MDFSFGFCKQFCGFSVTPEDFFPPERFPEKAALADPFVEPAHRDPLGDRRVLPEGRVLGELVGPRGSRLRPSAPQQRRHQARVLLFFLRK